MIRFSRYLAILVLVGVVFISIGARTSLALDPRCDPDFWKIQKTDAKARVVVDTAQTAAISKQNDSVLAQTCFDKALLKIARAGNIFSDKNASDFGFGSALTSLSAAALNGFNGGSGTSMLGLNAITGLNYLTSGPSAGTRGGSLIDDLNSTVTDALTGLMDDFIGSVTSILTASIGAALTTTLNTVLGSTWGNLMSTALSSILGGLDGYNFECDATTEARSMLGIWKNNIIGQGLSASVIDLDEALVYAALGIEPPRGFRPEFKAKLDNRWNKEILRTAYHDNKVNLPVPTSPLKFVKSIPALYVDSTVADVIRAMDEIEEKPGYIPLPQFSTGLISSYETN